MFHITPGMASRQISDLKAHLSETLRSVQRGETVTVLDRKTPIARLVPYTPAPVMRSRPATGKFSELPMRRRRPAVSPEALAAASDAERTPWR